MTFLDYFETVFLPRRIGLSVRSAYEYQIVARQFDSWKVALISEVDEPLIVEWLRSMMGSRSARTVNNKRQMILTVLRDAKRRGYRPDVPEVDKLPEPRRIPSAWSIEEIGLILRATRKARMLPGWDSRHWRALILTVYDTSLRIGALLATERADLTRDGHLLCRAEHQKQNCDTLHRLHRDTMSAIDRLPGQRLLFPWPLHRRAIWVEYGLILDASGLPSGARDKFHKIRRTSYTYTYRELGPQAASQHAGHHCDLSAAYLDPTKLDRTEAIDVLPRPA